MQPYTDSERESLIESDPSKMFKYDAETGSLQVATCDTCTFDGEIIKKVSGRRSYGILY